MAARKFDLHGLVHSVASSLRRNDGLRADKYWEPIIQIAWELECLLRESGFVEALPKQINAITIMSCFDTHYGFDPETAHMEGKKQFEVYVHLDASNYANSPPDEDRYWPELTVCLEALCYAAEHFNMPQTVKNNLQVTRAKFPSGPPWPPLPPFDIADVVRHYNEQKSAAVTADSDGRVRVVKQLQAEEGVLWIMCGPMASSVDESIDRLQGDLREFVAEKKLGQWDGDSRNGPVSDISFQVDSLKRAGTAVEGFLRERWPLLDFVIAEEYDPEVFEKVR